MNDVNNEITSATIAHAEAKIDKRNGGNHSNPYHKYFDRLEDYARRNDIAFTSHPLHIKALFGNRALAYKLFEKKTRMTIAASNLVEAAEKVERALTLECAKEIELENLRPALEGQDPAVTNILDAKMSEFERCFAASGFSKAMLHIRNITKLEKQEEALLKGKIEPVQAMVHAPFPRQIVGNSICANSFKGPSGEVNACALSPKLEIARKLINIKAAKIREAKEQHKRQRPFRISAGTSSNTFGVNDKRSSETAKITPVM